MLQFDRDRLAMYLDIALDRVHRGFLASQSGKMSNFPTMVPAAQIFQLQKNVDFPRGPWSHSISCALEVFNICSDTRQPLFVGKQRVAPNSNCDSCQPAFAAK